MAQDLPTVGADCKPEWRCFHCGEVFTDEHCARIHFGRDEDSQTACQIKAGAEHGLIAELRRAENQLADMRSDYATESTESARFYYSQATRHNRQIVLAEESGYEKGLADSRVEFAPILEALLTLASGEIPGDPNEPYSMLMAARKMALEAYQQRPFA